MIPCHVNTGNENRFNIADCLVTRKGYPGIVMPFCVFFKGSFANDVFLKSAVFSDQSCSLFLGEFKREADTGPHGSREPVRDATRI